MIRCFTSSDPYQISDSDPFLNPTSEDPQQSSGAFKYTSEQGFTDKPIVSRSGLAPAPPLVPSHRDSLMARVSLGPSDVPSPVGTSTAHGELQSWQVASLCASPPTITSVLQNDGDPNFLLLATAALGFLWMGLISFCGPITPLWPISRSDLLVTLSSLSPNTCCLIKDGRRLHSILGTIHLEETCLYNSRNLMDKADWLSSDASLILKLSGFVFLSIHSCCDAYHTSALICEHISSMNTSTIKPNQYAPGLMGEASHHSRTISTKLPWYALSIPFSSLFKLNDFCPELNGRRLHPSLVAFYVFWTCDCLWRIQQTYSSKEIPFPQSYSGLGKKTPPVTSTMEQFTKSSYALFARAYYDHKLIRDFSKLTFKRESQQVSKDLPTFANFLKSCVLENSLSLYPYFPCNVLSLNCMNLPPLRV